MVKNLVIVESPAKARTIERFLGKDYSVRSSYGHIRDLSPKELSVDIENDFRPKYEIPEDKKKTIQALKKESKNAETIWLATDEDREGEAISWHLKEVLELDESRTRRIVFHEITKNAILEALENPRGIDLHLVDAQQARRVLDRLVGYELSPVLWKKVKPSLSAGRVQSVAVRLVVEREEEIKNFKTEPSFRITAEFLVSGADKGSFTAELNKRFKTAEEAKKFLEESIGAEFRVVNVEKKPGKKSPPPPFTTSTLQQEASRKLGFPVAKTMRVAQQLYEEGKITYMRTDSVNLSKLALAQAKELIEKNYGAEYSKTRQYTTRSKSAQEAHEAIRPTYLNQTTIEGTRDQQRLYDLIWKRTMASQMADAQLERTNIFINHSSRPEQFVATGEVIRFDGFLKVYMESTEDDEQETPKGTLPAVTPDSLLEAKQITAEERFTQPPPRYSEASLVRKLEELGIGRPSTYAPTISTIIAREYVVKETREEKGKKVRTLRLKKGKIEEKTIPEKSRYEKNKLFPTDIGIVVTRFLTEYFENILDYQFTANVEKEFDEIASGMKAWNEMIRQFYGPFHRQVEETLEKSKRQSGERLLGNDPQSGKPVFAKIGRYGAIVQIGSAEDEEKPKFAGLRPGQSIDNITLEEALDLFRLPRTLGKFENEEVLVGIGRFGPYVRHKNKFYSLQKEDDPYTITLERAIELMQEKKQKDRENLIKTFEHDPPVSILKGRYGPYIKQGKTNCPVPKNKDPESLTLEECLELIEKYQSRKKSRKK
ncbi:MAG: type I DNA topoisomerase [Bacteroidales bacterium]